MRSRALLACLAAVAAGWLLVSPGWLLVAPAATAAEGPAPSGQIDFNYARQLNQKAQSGQTLTAEERAYLDRALAERAKRAGGGGGPAGGGPVPQAAPAATEKTGLVPLAQMAAQDRYKGEDGGLYGGGSNTPPESHLKAAQAQAARIVPLDAEGRPATDGKIVLLSMGMSNTTQEFSKFKELADADPAKGPHLVIVDGAQGGKDAALWNARENTPVWDVAARRLEAAGVTAKQVQVAWVKHARIGPSRFGEFPGHAKELKDHIAGALALAREHYPNLHVAYLSSRIYAGYATTPLNPEPFAYESAFAVRWVIQDQVKGEARLNFDPARGDVKSPLVLWGPYLWGDGLVPRKADGLVWKREDLAGDGTHPSPGSGREKVARLLLEFVKTDATAKAWFSK
ncbi:MAG: hypothetical protein NTX87_16530 [Planctomycetota bacterium]|nr:hypothetical protein [Planctomycetota bacterium]